MNYTDALPEVADKIVTRLLAKDKEYGGSWLKRGGVGVFMMLARKWDRIENQVSTDKFEVPEGRDDSNMFCAASKFDLLEHALRDGRDEGVRDDLEDLVGYCLLALAEIQVRADTTVPVGPAPATTGPFGYVEDEHG